MTQFKTFNNDEAFLNKKIIYFTFNLSLYGRYFSCCLNRLINTDNEKKKLKTYLTTSLIFFVSFTTILTTK